MTEATNSANAAGIFEPFDIARIPWRTFTHGERFGMRDRHLSSFGGGARISVSMEVLEPGRQADQTHDHLVEEEHAPVPEGAMTRMRGERRHARVAGQHVCFPAGQAVGPASIDEADAACRCLVLGNPQPHDVAVQTEAGRVIVKSMGEGYRRSATMDDREAIDGPAGLDERI